VTKSEGLPGRYLYSVLVDGSRNFRYRNRVRSLLGLPSSEGVKVSFGSVLSNMMNFTYSRPQFTGEFYFQDEFPDQPAYSLTYIEDEFINLTPAHRGSDKQSGEPVKHVSDRKPHFSESSLNRLVAKADQNAAGEQHYAGESAHLGEGLQEPKPAEMDSQIQSPSPTNPANPANAFLQEATMGIPKIPERRNREEPNPSKGEAKHSSEIQLLSGSGGEQPIHAQAWSDRNLPYKVETTRRTQTELSSKVGDELWQVDAQAQSGESLLNNQLASLKPSITHLQMPEIAEPAQATLPQMRPFIPTPTDTEAQTPSNVAPPQFALPYIKPKVRQTQSLEWNEEELEEQEWNLESTQLPDMKMRARDNVTVPQPTSPRTKRETKPDKTSPSGQGQIPTASQQANVLWQGIEPPSKFYAFWERRHLNHHQLRRLR